MNISHYSIALLMFVYQSASGQSLLWRISGNGLVAPSYLYGTIHIKDKRVFSFTDSVIVAQVACRATVLELELGNETSSHVSQMLALPSGETLSDYYSEAELDVLRSVVEEKTNIPFSVFRSMRPAALLSLLSESYFSSDMPYALDEYFQHEAERMGKDIIGLETVQEQFDAISAISPEMIFDYITDTAKQEDMSEQMISAYLKADFDSLSALLATDSLTMQYSDKLLENRNKTMAMRIDSLVREQTCFVAIGAGHLKGKDGVIDLLKSYGYALDPVGGLLPARTREVAGLQTNEWFSYTADNFSVAFPAEPQESSAPFALGEDIAKGVILLAQDVEYQYSLMQLPAIDDANAIQKLRSAAESAAYLFGGAVLSVTEFGNDTAKGIDADISLGTAGVLLQRHIVMKDGYFVLQIMSMQGPVDEMAKKRFFHSFSYCGTRGNSVKNIK